ncbi:hypothetical protein C1N70_13810 [Cytobacillus firmus]
MFSAHAPSITIEEKADHQLFLLLLSWSQTAFLWWPQFTQLSEIKELRRLVSKSLFCSEKNFIFIVTQKIIKILAELEEVKRVDYFSFA